MAAQAHNFVVPDEAFDSKEERAEVLRSIRHPQDEDERREIREEYRRIQDNLAEHRQDLVNPADEDDLLTDHVEKADKLFKKVRMTREGAQDSATLLNLSELGKTKAQALRTDAVDFRPADFCDKLRVLVAGDLNVNDPGLSHNKWLALGNSIQSSFKRTPVLRFMCGSFERGEVILKKPRPAREREKEKDVEGKATKPTQLSSLEETDRGELTTAQVEHLLDTLWRAYEKQGGSPICFFEFVTNPHSFGKTVENIFYASFLVRDGHARVFLDEDQLPAIEPIKREERGDSTSKSVKQQVVLSITPEEWEEIVQAFEIEEPLIKDVRKEDVLKEKNRPADSPAETVTPYQGKGKGKGKKSIR